MPHHSGNQRQANAYSVTSSNMMQPNSNVAPYPNVDYRSMPSHAMQMQPQHPPAMMRMVGPPPPGMTWMSMSSEGQQQIHHVAPGTPDQASKSKDEDDDAGTPKSLLKPAKTHSFESPHDVAASVLLLASSGGVPPVAASKKTKTNREETETDDSDSEVKMPLKKRKKVADILRQKPDAYHVSPMSNSSKTTAEAASPPAANASGDSSRASSYDLKEGQALPETAKISDAKDINISVPDFPSILHKVLTQSEFAGSVAQWLPHGKAWRIVRWDALRKQVLPKYFPQLRDEEGGNASIDAFLGYLSAWGFEEITSGPDVGAYCHKLFRRGLPNLAKEIEYCPPDDEDSKSGKTDVADGDGARRILQVPSLTSTAGTAETHHTTKEDNSESTPPRKTTMSTIPVGHSPIQTWSGMQQHAAAIQYRLDDTEVWQYHHPEWMNVPPPPQYRPPYSPVRIRSGRGAARLAASRKPLSPTTTTVLHRFPISNRGSKAGSRRAAGGGSSVCSRSSAKTEVTMLSKTDAASSSKVDVASSSKEADATTSCKTEAKETNKADTTTKADTTEVMSTNNKTTTEDSLENTKSPLRSVLKRKLPLAGNDENNKEDNEATSNAVEEGETKTS